MDMAEAQILPAMLEVGERVLGKGGGQGWEARRHPSTEAAPPTWNVAKPSTPRPAFDLSCAGAGRPGADPSSREGETSSLAPYPLAASLSTLPKIGDCAQRLKPALLRAADGGGEEQGSPGATSRDVCCCLSMSGEHARNGRPAPCLLCRVVFTTTHAQCAALHIINSSTHNPL
jgi:hypothetical protein